MRSTESASSARRAQGQESRERLIEAAIGAISERGYAATSVGDICKIAGVAKTALYWHFDSKEGLLAIVLERIGSSWIEQIQKSVYMEGEPLQRLDRLLAGWREILVHQPHLIRLPLFLQLGASDTSESIHAAIDQLVTRARQAIVQGIEDTIGVEMRDLDMLAHTIVTLLQGVVLYQLQDASKEGLDRVFEEFRRTVIVAVWSRLPPDVQAQLQGGGEA